MIAQGSCWFAFTLDTVDESKNRSNGAKVHGNLTKECIKHQESLMDLDTRDESESRVSSLTLESSRISPDYFGNLHVCCVYSSTNRGNRWVH